MRADRLFTLLAVAVLVLAVLPVGTAVFILGFILGDSPCILCWEQRIGMALIALVGLFVLRYGAKPFYLGLAVLVGVWGIYMGVRHSALHLARDIGQGFSAEILGAHTYTWSFFIFWCSTAAIAALIMLASEQDVVARPAPRPLRRIDRLAFAVFLVVIAANIVQAFASTGPPPFVGQADPVRFSFNPRHWVWSLGEFEPAPIGLRGRWAVEKPDVARADPDPGDGPLRGLPVLAVAERRTLNLALRGGTPSGLAYDAATDRFLVTTEHGVHVTSGALDRVERHTVIDPLFAVDLARFVDGAFLDSRTVVAVSDNKSFVTLRESSGGPDAAGRNFRYFLESFGDFDEVARSRFTTVRARLMYVMSAAFDTATKSIFTVAVPNAASPRMVVSRFNTADMTLSEEFVPAFASDVSFAPRPGAPALERLYITAATVGNGRLYALSAAHSTLLAIDPAAHTVVAAYTIPNLRQPTGLAIKGGRFLIVTAAGEIVTVNVPQDRPEP